MKSPKLSGLMTDFSGYVYYLIFEIAFIISNVFSTNGAMKAALIVVLLKV